MMMNVRDLEPAIEERRSRPSRHTGETFLIIVQAALSGLGAVFISASLVDIFLSSSVGDAIWVVMLVWFLLSLLGFGWTGRVWMLAKVGTESSASSPTSSLSISKPEIEQQPQQRNKDQTLDSIHFALDSGDDVVVTSSEREALVTYLRILGFSIGAFVLGTILLVVSLGQTENGSSRNTGPLLSLFVFGIGIAPFFVFMLIFYHASPSPPWLPNTNMTIEAIRKARCLYRSGSKS